VNQKGSDIPVADFFGCIFNFPKSVKDFIIIFPLYTKLRPRGTFTEFTPHINVMDTCELIGTDAICTLVGLDKCPVPRFNTMAALRQHLNLLTFTGPKSKQECIEEILSHVRIVNKDEYSKDMDDIEIETVEHLYDIDSLDFLPEVVGTAFSTR
jgi:hypothetical protein